MLREIRGIRQHEGEPPRRWFTDHYWDLFVWESDEEVVAFQLCYGKPDAERSLSWRRGAGFSHHAVDDGEGHPASHRTPILVVDGAFDSGSVRDRFRADSGDVEPRVADTVLRELARYAAAGRSHNDEQ